MLRRWLREAGHYASLFQSVIHTSSEDLIDAARCRTHDSMTEEISSACVDQPQIYRGAIPMGQETPVPPRPQ